MWKCSNKIKKIQAVISFGLFLFFNASIVFAGDAVLSWDANTEADLAGYKVYHGTASGDYGIPIDIGNQTTYTVSGLDLGEHYFAVSAYDTSGNESGVSTEVSKIFSTTSGTLPGETSLGDTMQFTAASGGGGGCGLIRPGDDQPSGPEDSAEMMGMIALMLLIVFKKWLKASTRETPLSEELFSA